MQPNRAVLKRVAGWIAFVGACVVLGALTADVNNAASIAMSSLAMIAGLVMVRRQGVFGLLLLWTWTLWYPIYLQPLASIGGQLTRGITVTDAAVLAIGSFALVRDLMARENRITRMRVIALCGLGAAGGWILTGFSAPLSVTLPSARSVLFAVFVAALASVYTESGSQAMALVRGVLASALIQSGLIFWGQYLGHMPFYDAGLTVLLQETSRLRGIYTLPGALPVEVWGSRVSGVLAATTGTAAVLGAYASTNRSRVAAGLIGLTSGVLLYLSGGRTGWLGLALGLLAALGAAMGSRALRVRPLAAVVSVPAVVLPVALGASGLLSGEIGQRAATVGSWLGDSSVTVRVQIWELALSLLRAHPLGIGFGTLIAKYGYFEHNAYLVLANGVGPVGLMSFAALWYWLSWRSVRLVRTASAPEALIGLVGVVTMVAVLAGGMAENTPFVFQGIWVVWGAAVGLSFQVDGAAEPGVEEK